MIDVNYEKMVERIAKSSNLEKEEVQRKVEAKCAKLSGLISKEGADKAGRTRRIKKTSRRKNKNHYNQKIGH